MAPLTVLRIHCRTALPLYGCILTKPSWLRWPSKILLITSAVILAGDSFRYIPQKFDTVMDLLPQSCLPTSICVCLCHSQATRASDLCSSIADRRQYHQHNLLVCCSWERETERELLSDQGKPGKRTEEKQEKKRVYGQLVKHENIYLEWPSKMVILILSKQMPKTWFVCKFTVKINYRLGQYKWCIDCFCVISLCNPPKSVWFFLLRRDKIRQVQIMATEEAAYACVFVCVTVCVCV